MSLSEEGHFETGKHLDVAPPSLAALSHVYSESQELRELTQEGLKNPVLLLEKKLS